jgi:NADPH2:quinone reductase
MYAAWFDRFGEAKDILRYGEVETPVAGPGEVLVRVKTSAINPSDVKKRAGSFMNLLDDGFVIPNSDGAGVIEAVGEGVDKSRLGERVWLYQAQFARRFGTAAEFVAIDSGRAPRLHEDTVYEVGACLGIPAMTAHRAVFADGDVSGQTILVTGGAGRVGYYAIQWASQAGATVIASASKYADRESCEKAGAHHIVDHRSEYFKDSIFSAAGGKPIDRVIDVEFGANLETSVAVLKVGGVIATYSSTQDPQPKLPFLHMMYKDLTVRMIIVYAMPEGAKAQAIYDIDRALTRKRLHHRIVEILPMSEIVKGNEIIEEGKVRGSIILSNE